MNTAYISAGRMGAGQQSLCDVRGSVSWERCLRPTSQGEFGNQEDGGGCLGRE